MSTLNEHLYGLNKVRGVKQGTKRAPYATKKIETVTINFRVPKVDRDAAKDFVRPLLKEFLNKKR